MRELRKVPFQSEMLKICQRDYTVRLNRKLTAFHKDVVFNLECIHGALLYMNRSVLAA